MSLTRYPSCRASDASGHQENFHTERWLSFGLAGKRRITDSRLQKRGLHFRLPGQWPGRGAHHLPNTHSWEAFTNAIQFEKSNECDHASPRIAWTHCPHYWLRKGDKGAGQFCPCTDNEKLSWSN